MLRYGNNTRRLASGHIAILVPEAYRTKTIDTITLRDTSARIGHYVFNYSISTRPFSVL